MLRIIKWILSIGLCSLLISVAVVNRDSVSFNLPFVEDGIDLPLYIFLFLSITSGIILGSLVSLKCRFKSGMAARKSKKEIANLNDELSDMQVGQAKAGTDIISV